MRTILTSCLLLLALSAGVGFAQSTEAPYVLIVNAANPVEELPRSEVAGIYLKRNVFWPDNQAIAPVDLPAGAELRDAFYRSVLKRSESALRIYWQQRIFSGRGVPPVELPTERDVVAYVSNHPGAIGYVSAGAALPESVRKVRVR